MDDRFQTRLNLFLDLPPAAVKAGGRTHLLRMNTPRCGGTLKLALSVLNPHAQPFSLRLHPNVDTLLHACTGASADAMEH